MRPMFSPVLRILTSVLIGLFITAQNSSAQADYQKPTSRVIRNEDGTRLNIKVDPHSQIVEETLEGANKAIVWRIVKELDDMLQPMRATKYDAANKVISRHRYLYLRGRLEEEEIRDADDKVLSKLVFFYDAKARMSRIEQLNAKGEIISISRASGPGANAGSKTSVSGKPSK